MNPAPSSAKDRSSEPAPLLFPWRGASRSLLATCVPLVLATLVFAVLLGLVRIKVAAPQFKMASKAALNLDSGMLARLVSWAL